MIKDELAEQLNIMNDSFRLSLAAFSISYFVFYIYIHM